jgi:hypothetical protein
MRDFHLRLMVWLSLVPTMMFSAMAQTGQSTGTLSISGQQETAPLVRMNGKSYVDIESLARLTHGSVRFQGNQIILTLPQMAGTPAPAEAQKPKTPQLSGAFLAAEIEALTAIREWRVSLVNAVQNNYPVTENWMGGLRRAADTKLELAVAAASTDPDHQALDLLRNEYTNMQQESDQFLTTHAKVNYISPDSFENNALDTKILTCERALASMAASTQFQDAPSCH